ncbi:MAG: hypothetical protein MJ247_00460 [Alphaproteobacteria bacterium]|nr:hypothetical protein [Alphaproteobacteria bacterium]
MEQEEQQKNAEKIVIDTLFGEIEEYVSKQVDEDENESENLFDTPVNDQSYDLPLVKVLHYKPKILIQKNLTSLVPYLNELSLYETQWGYGKKDEDREIWTIKVMEELSPILNSVKEVCEKEKIIVPKSIYAYMTAVAKGDVLQVYSSNKKELSFELPFQRRADGYSVIDKFVQGEETSVAFMAINMGRSATDIAKTWLMTGHDEQYQYLDGFIKEMIVAMAQFTTDKINKQQCCVGEMLFLGMAKDGNVKVQSALIKELDAAQIDVSFSRNYLMNPEYSALAMVLPK